MANAASLSSAALAGVRDDNPSAHSTHGGMRVLGTAVLLLAVSSCAATEPNDSSALVVADWDNTIVSALCVEGEEDYGSGPNAVTPIQEGIASFFGDIVVDQGCDATITASLTGEALSATYKDPDSPGSRLLLYTGAEVQGTISLKAEGESPLTATIAGYLAPPHSIAQGGWNPRAPGGAPFWGAAYDDVCRVLQRWFGVHDPHLSHCPQPATSAVADLTTVPGVPAWSEELRTEFLETCFLDETQCLCFLYGAESVLTDAEWLGVRDLDVDFWPEDIWARLGPVWNDCSP